MKQWIDLLSDDEYLVVEHVVEHLLDAPTTWGIRTRPTWATANNTSRPHP
ncbi:hypothetical protein ABZX34_09170 [Streptomyces sp. NPDC004362]